MASPVQKMKVLLAAEQALRDRFNLEALVSNTSLSCLTSGLGGSPLLVFIGAHVMPREGQPGSESSSDRTLQQWLPCWQAWLRTALRLMEMHTMPALGECVSPIRASCVLWGEAALECLVGSWLSSSQLEGRGWDGAQHEARRGCWAPNPLFGSSCVFLKTYFAITADIHYYVTFRCTT